MEPKDLESFVRCSKATAKDVVEGIEVAVPCVPVQNFEAEVCGELLQGSEGGAVKGEAGHEA